jgi:ribosome maturation factor RimP
MGVDLPEKVRACVAVPVQAQGAHLEDVEVVSTGGRTVVRLIVDTDGGVTLDEAAAINRSAGAVLAASDLMGDDPYVLEVTSPGVGRPLTLPRHWRRNIGRLVRVRFKDQDEAVTGRISEAGDDTAVLITDAGRSEIDLADIDRAVVQVEFTRPEGG